MLRHIIRNYKTLPAPVARLSSRPPKSPLFAKSTVKKPKVLYVDGLCRAHLVAAKAADAPFGRNMGLWGALGGSAPGRAGRLAGRPALLIAHGDGVAGADLGAFAAADALLLVDLDNLSQHGSPFALRVRRGSLIATRG